MHVPPTKDAKENHMRTAVALCAVAGLAAGLDASAPNNFFGSGEWFSLNTLGNTPPSDVRGNTGAFALLGVFLSHDPLFPIHPTLHLPVWVLTREYAFGTTEPTRCMRCTMMV